MVYSISNLYTIFHSHLNAHEISVNSYSTESPTFYRIEGFENFISSEVLKCIPVHTDLKVEDIHHLLFGSIEYTDYNMSVLMNTCQGFSIRILCLLSGCIDSSMVYDTERLCIEIKTLFLWLNEVLYQTIATNSQKPIHCLLYPQSSKK